MLDYKHIEALVAVVEEQHFEKAARKLFISQSAVSQRIKTLETRVGQPLLIRSTPPSLTPVGRRLFKHHRQVHALESELLRELELADSEDFSKLVIGTNADSLAIWLLEALQPVFDKQNILVEIHVDDQADTPRFLKSGEVFGCITSNELPMHGCMHTYLGEMRYHLVSTPAFKKKYFSNGMTKKNVLKAPAVIFNKRDRLHSLYLDKFYNITEDPYPFHIIPSSEGFVKAALSGAAYALLPWTQFKPHKKARELVDLMPGKAWPVKLYWQAWYLQTTQMKLVSDSLKTAAKRVLQ